MVLCTAAHGETWLIVKRHIKASEKAQSRRKNQVKWGLVFPQPLISVRHLNFFLSRNYWPNFILELIHRQTAMYHVTARLPLPLSGHPPETRPLRSMESGSDRD